MVKFCITRCFQVSKQDVLSTPAYKNWKKLSEQDVIRARRCVWKLKIVKHASVFNRYLRVVERVLWTLIGWAQTVWNTPFCHNLQNSQVSLQNVITVITLINNCNQKLAFSWNNLHLPIFRIRTTNWILFSMRIMTW